MFHSRHTLTVLTMCLVLLTGSAATAAPGTIAQSPLFLATQVQPNIFFMIDDSGSMDWEDMMNAGVLDGSGNDLKGASFFDYSGLQNPPHPFWGAAWERLMRRALCRGVNIMAYDPNVTYTPWVGVDAAGQPFQNMTLTTARFDPYDPGSVTDISDHVYWVWNDADGDGEYDGPLPVWGPNDPANDECGDISSNASGVQVASLPPDQQQNYANWWTYYRKREYVVKRALSELISESTARMGISFINHQGWGFSTPIRDVDDISTPIDQTAKNNKEFLLDQLFSYFSSGGTPLRSGLEFAGEYYSGKLSSPWDSPILPASQGGECQQNFTILMSDGFWNGFFSGLGNTDADGSGPWDGYSYADAWSDTLADIAMHYYETDLAPGLADKVPMTSVDVPLPPDSSITSMHQHMVTFTVAFGLDGTLSSNPPDRSTPHPWPQPTENDITTVDDMRHAAWNGRGEFLSARDPQELISSLGAAIAEIEARTATASAVTFNSTSLQAGALVFQAIFNSANWSGDLIAKHVDSQGNIGAEAWRATTAGTATGLDDPGFSWSTRKVYTWNGTKGVAFDWNNLTANQKADLATNPDGSQSSEDTAKARMRYILGERSCEQSSTETCLVGTHTFKVFRDRSSRMGDIVHSSPYYVGIPNSPYPDKIEPAPYSTFVKDNKNRTGVVYVGSNDGMLHAFNAQTGVELFAYIPEVLSSMEANKGLHYLTDPTYEHRYYVDLSPRIGDAYLNGKWRTILLGGLRGGGKGLFALDITDPTSFSETDVLWEFTHNDLGYTFSEAFVVKLNNGKWAAVFGNGYNNDPWGDGTAKLFIVYLDGSNLSSPVIIETGVGAMVNGDCGDPFSDCNGLSSPALADLNGDGTVDRAYAGDLHGNLWVFDLSSSNPAGWKLAYPDPLFSACSVASSPGGCPVSKRQPITSRPALARHVTERSEATRPNVMVFFGTGQYLTKADSTSTSPQSFYGIWDANAVVANGRNDLVQQTLTQVTSGKGEFRYVTDKPVDYSSKRGWYIDLVSGERVVTNAHAIGDLVFFNTMIPSSGACSYGGTSWLMSLDQYNGGIPGFTPFDTNGDGVIDTNDLIGGKVAIGRKVDSIASDSTFISDKRYTATTSGDIISGTYQAGRIRSPYRTSWTTLDIE